jgi:hypothetical protein
MYKIILNQCCRRQVAALRSRHGQLLGIMVEFTCVHQQCTVYAVDKLFSTCS